MATKLTPETLRRIVLEEKKKIEKKQMMDKKALSDLEMDMDESDWSDAKPVGKGGPYNKPGGDMHAPGTLKEMRAIREQETALRNRLRKLQERRLAIRRQALRDLE